MTEFLGRPVEGDVNHYSSAPVEQAPPEIFLEALDELLATDGVKKVRWHQYTPYFNDGEACVFGVGEASVSLGEQTGEDSEVETDAGYFSENEEIFYTTYDLYRYENGYGSDLIYEMDGKSTKHLHDALKKFSDVLYGGHHDVTLNSAFGDPAEVTATTDGFSVEFYDHD